MEHSATLRARETGTTRRRKDSCKVRASRQVVSPLIRWTVGETTKRPFAVLRMVKREDAPLLHLLSEAKDLSSFASPLQRRRRAATWPGPIRVGPGPRPLAPSRGNP